MKIWPIILLFVSSLVFAGSGVQKLQLETSAGEQFEAYVAGPQDATAGVLLVHDWFGVSPFYLKSVERLASQGYRVVAVDVYGGQRADTHKDAWALMSALDAEATSRKIDAALVSLNGRSQVATFGFSMGAPHAMEASIRHADQIDATVVFYGETVNDPEAVGQLTGPVLLVVGSKDGAAADAAANFSKLMDESGPGAEIYILPGQQHAFAQPLFNAGETYDSDAAEAAWNVAEDFLQRQFEEG